MGGLIEYLVNMKKLFYICHILSLVLLSSHVKAQERGLGLSQSTSSNRVALVIGNSKYKINPLENPGNDARDISSALKELGFDVTPKFDLSLNQMKQAVREFRQKLRNDSVGLLFYAGHGIQVKGENYLIPVDANISSEETVEYEALNAGWILAEMLSARNKINILILDACRDNPFSYFRSSSRGLAPMVAPEDAPSGLFIAYATAPNSVARDGGNLGHGVYTQEILNNIKTPGLTVEVLFKRVRRAVSNRTQSKQVPWESTNLSDDFYFVEEAKVIANPSPIDLSSRPTPKPSATQVQPVMGREVHANLDVSVGKIHFFLHKCTYQKLEVICYFQITNLGPSKGILIQASEIEIEDTNGHKYASEKLTNEDEERNVHPFLRGSIFLSFNALFNKTSRISINFKVKTLLPANYPLKQLNFGWSWGKVDGSDYFEKAPAKFKNIPLTHLN